MGFTEYEIKVKEIMLDHIDLSKAVGTSGVFCRILKEFAYLIFKWFIAYGEVLENWKGYNVPVYKNSHKKYFGNYRPVDLPSLVIKVLDKSLKSHMKLPSGK